MKDLFELSLLMILLTSIEAVALTLLRVGGLWNIATASAIFAVAVVPLLAKALTYEGIGMVNFVWNVFSTLIMFFIGVYIFSEKITALKTIGICIALLGIGIIIVADDYQI
jgi:multidrug transporter EmrE-like cation transporter